jgi:hypothetical protein
MQKQKYYINVSDKMLIIIQAWKYVWTPNTRNIRKLFSTSYNEEEYKTQQVYRRILPMARPKMNSKDSNKYCI